jgi:DNA mismatch endonuclease, patch repair protein
MADIVPKAVRSRMMSNIKGINTKPEILIRKELFARGYRFRLHGLSLPGKPDLVFPKFRAVVFVHGCFWHRHHCHLFKWPSTRPEFWREKISGNADRDKSQASELFRLGWRILVIWECALKGKEKIPLDELVFTIDEFLRGDHELLEITGKQL